MYGNDPTGTIQGAVISAVSHEGLTVTVNGKPATLAIVTEDGKVFAQGPAVAREVEAVAINSYVNLLKGQGYVRVIGDPLKPAANEAPPPQKRARA